MRRFVLFVGFLLWTAPGWAQSIVSCTTLLDQSVTGQTTQGLAAFSPNPTVGNYIVVLAALVQIGGTGTGITSVTDGFSNTYSVDVQKTRSDTQVFSSISSAKVATSGASFSAILHFNNTGTSMALVAQACEVSGLAASSVLDKTGNNEINTGTSLTVTAAAQNSQADDIVFAVMAGINLSATMTTGYTSRWNSATNVGSGGGDKIVSSCETSAASASFSSADQIGVIATYKGSTTGGACAGGSTAHRLTLTRVGK